MGYGGRRLRRNSPTLSARLSGVEQRLAAESEPLLTLDVREHPELARKYGIAVVPTVFRVGADAVLKRLAP